jgi:glycosyltransferase involved in cell wall biosynthesis
VQLYDVAPGKISVIYLGVQKLESQKMISESGIRPYILFNGNREGYKNFSLLLRAYSESEYLRTNFDVYTFGGGKFSKEEIKLLNVLNLKINQVKNFQGEDSLLGYLYDNANIFVYPSLYEGFGLPPLEAMAHGCPVLSSNRGSMPEILGDAAEYFDPTQSVELSFKLNLILKSQTKMYELMQKGILRAQKYDWSECARQTEELYKNLFEKKSAI